MLSTAGAEMGETLSDGASGPPMCLLGFIPSHVSPGLGLLSPPRHGQLRMGSNQLQEGTASGPIHVPILGLPRSCLGTRHAGTLCVHPGAIQMCKELKLLGGWCGGGKFEHFKLEVKH